MVLVSAARHRTTSFRRGEMTSRLRPVAPTTETRYPDTLPTTWLAARMAIDPARIDGMRRAGQLIAVREPGSTEWQYPAWQFDGDKPRSGVERVVATARATGIDDGRLYELMTQPLGLRDGGTRLADLLAEGREDDVVAAIRSSR
jgi:hypothetical protein